MSTTLDLITDPVTLVRGPAASGKTMFLAWLAEEAYNEQMHVLAVGDDELANRIRHFCPAVAEKMTFLCPDNFTEVEAGVANAPLNALVLIDDFAFIGPHDPNNTMLGTAAHRVASLHAAASTRCKVVIALQGTNGMARWPSIKLKKT